MAEEQDIFDSAIEAEESVKPTQVSETNDEADNQEQAAQQPPEGQDEPGKVAGDAAQQQDQQPPQQPHFVPLKELLDTRERAQAAEREREELKRQIDTLTRQRQTEQQKPPELPDIFEKPEDFVSTLTQTFEQRLATMQLETNLQIAEVRHGETFTKAWDAFLGAVGTGQNPALYHQIMRSADPGGEMVKWFKREQVVREIGEDPTAYRTKLENDLLNDPAFMAKVLEKARGQAGGASQQNGSRPNTVTRLPSLNRQTSAAPAQEADDGDDSEEAIFSAARDSRGRFASG